MRNARAVPARLVEGQDLTTEGGAGRCLRSLVGWWSDRQHFAKLFDSLSEQGSAIWSAKWRSTARLQPIDAQIEASNAAANQRANPQPHFSSWRKACGSTASSIGGRSLHRISRGQANGLNPCFAQADRGISMLWGISRAGSALAHRQRGLCPNGKPSCAASRRALQASSARPAAVKSEALGLGADYQSAVVLNVSNEAAPRRNARAINASDNHQDPARGRRPC